MLREMLPPVARDDICGLEEQFEDILRNLYLPLENKVGKPMNTLMVGAPGVGKSLMGRRIAFERTVLTVPTSVKTVSDPFFDHYQIHNLNRIKGAIDLPMILLLDDFRVSSTTFAIS